MLFYFLSLFTLISAQGQFGAPENSAAILSALHLADDATVRSGQGAADYTPNNTTATEILTNENGALLAAWQNIKTLATSSQGFFTYDGAQAIIEFVCQELYPHTRDADEIYVEKRDVFVEGGFIDYINPGLLKLRTAVDAASAAIQAKTRAKQLTQMAEALLLIEQNYADTQEAQQFGPGGESV